MNIKEYVNRLRQSLLNLGLYFSAALIPMLLNFAINPLIALNMEPKDYAIVGFYSSFSSLLSPFISFYAFSYYAKKYFELDDNNRLILISTIFQSLIFLSFLLSALSIVIIYAYMKFFNNNSDMPFFPYAVLSILIIPLSGLLTLKLVEFKMRKDGKKFFFFSVGRGLVIVVFSVFFVVILKLGALGKISALFLSEFIYFFLVLSDNKRYVKTKFSWDFFKEMIFFVWPLVFGAMLHFFTNGFDRVYLERVGDHNELGYYVVAVQMVGYISIFITAINNTFQPDIYKAVVNNNYRSAAKYISVILGVVIIIVLVFFIFSPLIINLLTAGRYTDATKYARIISLSQLTMAMYYISSELLIVKGYTRLALISKVIGVLITILLYYLFISTWQFYGASIVLVLSYFVMMLINSTFIILGSKISRRKLTS